MKSEERIALDDPRRPDVRALLARHGEFALAQTPPERSFALDVDGLLDPAISVFTCRARGRLLRAGPEPAPLKPQHCPDGPTPHITQRE